MEANIGTVIWFNDYKGFGVIRDEKTQENIFAHYSEITLQKKHTSTIERKSLQKGMTVSYFLTENVTFHGLQKASNIRVKS